MIAAPLAFLFGYYALATPGGSFTGKSSVFKTLLNDSPDRVNMWQSFAELIEDFFWSLVDWRANIHHYNFLYFYILPGGFTHLLQFPIFRFIYFSDYWLFTILLYIAVMGIANLVAVIIPGKGKGLIANGLIVILWSFGGRTSYLAKPIPLSTTF